MSQDLASTKHDTVFIVDDDASVRDSLCLLLSMHGHATSSFASAEDFLSALRPHWRGCVIADIRMPGLSGLELQHKLRDRSPALNFVIVTAHGDVGTARTAFLADAVDFIEKPFDPEQLVSAVSHALARSHDQDALQDARRTAEMARDKLTDRERQVMDLMIRGLHNRHIARELGISVRTVEVHKARVMDKLGVRNLIEFARLMDQLRA